MVDIISKERESRYRAKEIERFVASSDNISQIEATEAGYDHMPKSKQESEALPSQMVGVGVVSNTKLHEITLSQAVDSKPPSDRVQEEQVGIERKVEEEESTNTSTKPDKIVEDTTRLEQLGNDNTVRCGGEEQNEAPNISNCEKEGGDVDNDNESICTVQISELDDLLPKDRKSIDEALECERNLRLPRCA